MDIDKFWEDWGYNPVWICVRIPYSPSSGGNEFVKLRSVSADGAIEERGTIVKKENLQPLPDGGAALLAWQNPEDGMVFVGRHGVWIPPEDLLIYSMPVAYFMPRLDFEERG